MVKTVVHQGARLPAELWDRAVELGFVNFSAHANKWLLRWVKNREKELIK